jgi:hypothetical protein
MNDNMTEVATMTRVAPPVPAAGFEIVEWTGNPVLITIAQRF